MEGGNVGFKLRSLYGFDAFLSSAADGCKLIPVFRLDIPHCTRRRRFSIHSPRAIGTERNCRAAIPGRWIIKTAPKIDALQSRAQITSRPLVLSLAGQSIHFLGAIQRPLCDIFS